MPETVKQDFSVELRALASLSGTGIVQRTAAETYSTTLSPTLTTIELGATDTTLARASAGNVSIEGNIVYRAGGTDVPLTDGGTGASSAADARTNLGLVIGTNVQAYDVELAALAGLTSAADGLPYFTGSGTAALATFTAAGRAIVDDADATAQRATLGLGTMATQAASGVAITGGSITNATYVGTSSITFTIGSTEIGRWTADGLLIGQTSSGGNAADFKEADTGQVVLRLEHSHATGCLGSIFAFTGGAPDDNTQYFLRCLDTGATRLFIYSDGDLQNHDNSYGGISDERLKDGIRDAPSQWDDIKALRVRKYRFKSDISAYGERAVEQIGVIAQEVLPVSPGLVTGTVETTYGIQYSVLYLKAIKALQEAMVRIEVLETRLAKLEAQG